MAQAITSPRGTSLEIAKLLHGYFTKTNKGWALISQAWMLDKLSEWYGHTIARSRLCYHLRLLVDDGFLKRTTRHRTNPETGQFEPRVTLYEPTMQLRALFNRLAAYFRGIGWRELISKTKEARAAQRRHAEASRQGERMSYEEFRKWRLQPWALGT